MKPYRCPMCFMRDIDVTFLTFDAAVNEHHCKQCDYSGSASEVDQLFAIFTRHRYKQLVRSHPYAERRRATV